MLTGQVVQGKYAVVTVGGMDFIMASIQCAIELYDGVSPVLGTMAESLDGLIGKLEALNAGGEYLGAMFDAEGIIQASSAMSGLSAGLDMARASSLGLAQGLMQSEATINNMAGDMGTLTASLAAMGNLISSVFSAASFESFIQAMSVVQNSFVLLTAAGELSAAALNEAYSAASQSIADTFVSMSSQVRAVFDSLGSYINSFAASLPSYFSGPLASIASMFSALAASAKASLASIASAASSTAASATRRHLFRHLLPEQMQLRLHYLPHRPRAVGR